MQTSERTCQCGNMDVQDATAAIRDEDGKDLAEFWVDVETGALMPETIMATGTGYRVDMTCWSRAVASGVQCGGDTNGKLLTTTFLKDSDPVAEVARLTAATCACENIRHLTLEFLPMAREAILRGLKDAERDEEHGDRVIWRLARKWQREVAKGKMLLEWVEESDAIDRKMKEDSDANN